MLEACIPSYHHAQSLDGWLYIKASVLTCNRYRDRGSVESEGIRCVKGYSVLVLTGTGVLPLDTSRASRQRASRPLELPLFPNLSCLSMRLFFRLFFLYLHSCYSELITARMSNVVAWKVGTIKPGLATWKTNKCIMNSSVTKTVIRLYILLSIAIVTLFSCKAFRKALQCDECDGTGKVEVQCAECNGYGIFRCGRCGGAGSLVCINCYGSGRVECTLCYGTGRDGMCFLCSGSGYDSDGWRCFSCNGTGKSECNWCSSLGYTNCDNCYGSGKITCDECNGYGRLNCITCSGEGKVEKECPKCNGSGKRAR